MKKLVSAVIKEWSGPFSAEFVFQVYNKVLCGAAGPQLSVPQDATVKQLNLLLNQLLANDEKLPYSFFVEEQELASSLGEHLQKNKVIMPAGYAQHRSISSFSTISASHLAYSHQQAIANACLRHATCARLSARLCTDSKFCLFQYRSQLRPLSALSTNLRPSSECGQSAGVQLPCQGMQKLSCQSTSVLMAGN